MGTVSPRTIAHRVFRLARRPPHQLDERVPQIVTFLTRVEMSIQVRVHVIQADVAVQLTTLHGEIDEVQQKLLLRHGMTM